MKFKRLSTILILCVLPLFFSCSRAEPRIVYGFIELIYYPGSAGPEERFSFFILPEDDDGVENLSELYLYHDREGLRWLITSEDWIEYEEAGRIWIGTRSIAMPSGFLLPRGQYRAVLVNKGGESTERNFTYDGPEISPYPFPSLTIEGNYYTVESQYPINYFLCYDQQGKAVQTLLIQNRGGNIGTIGLIGTVRTVALWAEDQNYHLSALTEAVSIR
ncbi:MAG: hypothetical protein LBQ94_01895 [Treponema sp.]|jgi:hypothetical protein|nr:hypothetical protein [Treponema sp.]